MKTPTNKTAINRLMRSGVILASFVLIGFAYQNCSQTGTGFAQTSANASFSSLSSEDDLFNMLQEARELSALLKTYDLSADSASDVLSQAPSISNQLSAEADKIEKAVTVDNVPTNSNVVLKEVDTLVNLLAKGREIHVAYDSIRRDKLLSLRIDDIQANLNKAIQNLAALGGAFNEFKTAITARVDALTVEMSKWEERLGSVNQAISDLATKTEAQDLALKAALESLKDYTKTELAGVKQQSQDLQTQITKQASDQQKLANQIKQAQDEMAKLGNISSRLCQYNDAGRISDSRVKCTSATQSGDCCLTVDVIDCSQLFPAATASAALNQCSLLVSIIKNHDQQLQAIQAVDEKQNAAISQISTTIDGVISNVSSLNNSVNTLADGLTKVQVVTDQLANQIGSIKNQMAANDAAVKAKLADLDTRTMLLEFKANRQEVINGLQARANATLAWATMRYAQINSQFCSSRRNQALAMFDYKAARQNIEYCIEKRGLATLAQSMASVANAYAGLLGSLNVDSDCSANINGKIASSLTNDELMDDNTLKAVTSQCTSGGQVVARALMINIVRYLKQIGPDFRTYDSMKASSKAVNIAFFGTDWASVSSTDQKSFDNVDPTSDQLKNTPYGQVERIFVYNYYSYAFRDSNGKFISDATKVNANVPGSVFTEAQLLAAAQVGKNLPDYMNRVRSLEAQNYCQECGFKISGRSNPDSNKSSLVIVHGDGKSRFYFPNDPKTDLCPVDDDVVVRQNDGKHYVYHLTFDSWGNDILTPVLTRGLATVIADSDADMASGNFNYCYPDQDVKVERAGLDMASIPTRLTIRATRPYGPSYGRPQCTKLTAVCAVHKDDWQAPSNLNLSVADLNNPATANILDRYLVGLPSSVIGAMCGAQLPANGAPNPVYTADRNIASVDTVRGLHSAWSNPNGSNASSRAQAYVALGSTQLVGSAYWPFQDGALPYTADKIMLSSSKSFAMPPTSSVMSSTQYIREADGISSLMVQECSHCPANLKMLGGCGIATQ